MYRPAARSPASRALLAVIGLALFAGFIALGSWQLQRRVWKLDLIRQVDQRVRAAPVAAPGRSEWPRIGKADEYRRVTVDGGFVEDRETLVQAVTERGPGFWVMTPLQTREGFLVLVNRGFVEADRRSAALRGETLPQGPARVSGLLRLTEPNGGFLRRNDPDSGRWYSRDVAAIGAARQLPAQDIAPYFIDADAGPGPADQPIGGLTVIRFHNSHLVYAITWYTLALMVAGAAVIVGRQEVRLRQLDS